MKPITTFTLFRYKGFANKFWGLSQMGLAHRRLRKVEGSSFYKMLGTGGSGFSTRPDWGVYAMLQVWESESAALNFFDSHPIMQSFRKRTAESVSLFMHPIRSRGNWNGQNPFEKGSRAISVEGPVAVLTRATIRKRYLYRFWSYVPTSQRPLGSMPGLIYSKGVGETPFIDMATISLWESAASMEAYAYGTDAHKGAIRQTRALDWYREELFARFLPYRTMGSWEGIPDLDIFRGQGNTEKAQ